MKHIHYYILCISLLLFSVLHVRAERIDTLLHFNMADLRIDTVTASDGQTYTKLSYPGCGNGDYLGAPAIPVRYITFSLPINSTNIALNAITSNEHASKLNAPLFPIQYPEAFMDYSSSFVSYNKSFYDTMEYPSSHATIKEKTKFLDSLFVVVTVFPIKYFPKQDVFVFSENVQLSITYDTQIEKETKGEEKTKNTRSINLPTYEYTVITTRNLKEAFRRLIGWKRQKGYDAGVVCVEDIIDNPQIVGEFWSYPNYSLTDSAAQIREYLRYVKEQLDEKSHYENVSEMRYVLMGGDYSLVPIRYGTGSSNTNHYDYRIPSDLYYSELDSNWNRDNDEYLGEPENIREGQIGEIGYGANFYVGRLLCKTKEDVENYTDKLLRYELNPGNGNNSYLSKALYVQADEAQKDSIANHLAAENVDAFPDSLIISEIASWDAGVPVAPTGNLVVSKMNNRYGFVSFNAHGTPYEIFARTSSVNQYHGDQGNYFYAVTSKQGARTISISENANSLNKLTNNLYPMVASSVSCYSAPLDIYARKIYYDDIYRVYNEYPNLAQSFTLGKNYGGPVWIGCSRMGIKNVAPVFQSKYINYMRGFPVGAAIVKSRAYGSGDFKHYAALSMNLIGCPELYVWTKLPSSFSISVNQNGDWVCHPQFGGSGIYYYSLRNFMDEPESVSLTKVYYSGYGEVISPDNNIITFWGGNHLPKILPFAIKDGVASNSCYVFTKDVIIGNGTANSESVTFENGADYVFETSGTFTLGKNVIINNGAKICIKPSNINF